jgi:acetyltransferase-like isoleucine patch superfamily enzyme
LGKNISFISINQIKFGALVWIGKNVYIDASSKSGVLFANNVTIRENVSIQCRSGLNEKGVGLNINEGSFIGPFCKIGIGGAISIGKNVQIGSHCSFNAESHILKNGNYTTGAYQRLGITIEDNVWVGDGVIILDGVNVGKNSVIGAGSVVNKSIPSGVIVAGVPARVIRRINA